MSEQESRQPRILFVGKTHRDEFQLIWEKLPECFRRWVVTRESIFGGDVIFSEEESIFDFIFLFQSFPGEFLLEDVERLRENFPVTPISVILGSWCEGEERNGEPLGNIPRFHWAEWITSAPRELSAFGRGEMSVFSLPATLTPEDGFLWRAELERKREDLSSVFSPNDPAEFCRKKKEPISIFIYSTELEQAEVFQGVFQKDETLRHITKCVLFSDFSARSLTSPEFLLVDFSEFSSKTENAFLALKKYYPRATCFVFCEFPRVEHWRWLEEHGARWIFRKPFWVSDFRYYFLNEIKRKAYF